MNVNVTANQATINNLRQAFANLQPQLNVSNTTVTYRANRQATDSYVINVQPPTTSFGENK